MPTADCFGFYHVWIERRERWLLVGVIRPTPQITIIAGVALEAYSAFGVTTIRRKPNVQNFKPFQKDFAYLHKRT